MGAKGRLEVSGLVEFVLELLLESVVVGFEEIGLHLILADHSVPDGQNVSIRASSVEQELTQMEGSSLVSIQDGKRVNEWEVLSNFIEL